VRPLPRDAVAQRARHRPARRRDRRADPRARRGRGAAGGHRPLRPGGRLGAGGAGADARPVRRRVLRVLRCRARRRHPAAGPAHGRAAGPGRHRRQGRHRRLGRRPRRHRAARPGAGRHRAGAPGRVLDHHRRPRPGRRGGARPRSAGRRLRAGARHRGAVAPPLRGTDRRHGGAGAGPPPPQPVRPGAGPPGGGTSAPAKGPNGPAGCDRTGPGCNERTMSRLPRLRAWAAGHRRALAMAGTALVAVVALVAVLLTWRTHSPDTRAGPPPPTTTTTAPTTTTTAPPPAAAPLTGVTGDFGGRLERPALFVKIDNVERARPPVGLDAADIVFEERVEGDLTRL